MTCLEFAEIAQLYASEAADGASAASCEAHLDVCASCAREFKKMKQADAVLRSAALGEPIDTANVDARVRECIAADLASRTPQGVSARRKWAIAALAVAAAAALYVIGYPTLAPHQGLLAAAAQDHHREVVEHGLRRWVRDPNDIAAFAAENGIAQQVLSTIAPAGYHLDRAKRCPLDGVSFVHLVYSNGQQEFSVFLRAGPAVPGNRISGSAARASAQSGAYKADFASDHVECIETPRLTALTVASRDSAPAVSLDALRRSL